MRRKIMPITRLELSIPLDLRTKLDLHLTSELEGRVPFGKYSEFFERLLRDYFNSRGQG